MSGAAWGYLFWCIASLILLAIDIRGCRAMGDGTVRPIAIWGLIALFSAIMAAKEIYYGLCF